MATIDITIYGAGIFGLCTAYACLKRGARVQIIDPFGAGAGASGGVVGALAAHTPDAWDEHKQFQLESLLMARHFWPQIEHESGLQTGYCRNGRLQAIENAHKLELARARTEEAKKYWKDKAIWRIVKQKPHQTWHSISPTGYLIYDTLCAHIHPALAIKALARAIELAGGVFAKKPTQDSTKCITLWATGWQGITHEALGKGVKGQAAVFEYNAKGAAQLYAKGLHAIPHANGTVAIGSTTEAQFEHPETVDEKCEELIEKARYLFPMLQQAKILYRWAGVRPKACRKKLLLGSHPNRTGDYIANGGFKTGFGMAPKVGEVMAELMINGRNDIPLSFRT